MIDDVFYEWSLGYNHGLKMVQCIFKMKEKEKQNKEKIFPNTSELQTNNIWQVLGMNEKMFVCRLEKLDKVHFS